jgi:Xaa-Pro aminopeptidase
MSDNTSLAVDLAACRTRQRRVLDIMQRRQLDWVVLVMPEHVQYLTGPRFLPHFFPAVALRADGYMTLVANSKFKGEAAADDVLLYEAQLLSTLRNDQRAACSKVLLDTLGEQLRGKNVGVEFSACGPHLAVPMHARLEDIEPDLFLLRRKKEPDELAKLKKAIAATGKMYEAARKMIAPGVNELEVFSQLQAVAVREFGEQLTGTGNDYASGARGGPPRDRAIQDGELYILDLGPAYRGYFADNCRAIAVNGKPTELQLRAWEAIVPVLAHVKQTVRPGKSCKQLFFEAKEMLAPSGFTFDHHLGHGIGLFPHEAPHLNPNWDDTFQAGEVFACEPGLYHPDLRAGIRLENDYLVTETGVELLSDFPLEL